MMPDNEKDDNQPKREDEESEAPDLPPESKGNAIPAGIPASLMPVLEGIPADKKENIVQRIQETIIGGTFPVPRNPDIARAEFQARTEISKHGADVALADINSKREENLKRLDIYHEIVRNNNKLAWLFAPASCLIGIGLVALAGYLITSGNSEMGFKILTYVGVFVGGGGVGYGVGKSRKRNILED